MSERMMRALLGARFCLWGGSPPCPLCGEDHGDPDATAELDAGLREIVRINRSRGPLTLAEAQRELEPLEAITLDLLERRLDELVDALELAPGPLKRFR